MVLRERTVSLLAAACLAAFAGLAIHQVARKSATWDEFLHLTAGYAAVTRGDYRIGSAHPPFQHIWNALPLLGMKGIRFEPDPSPAAQTPAERKKAVELTAPYRFFYQDNDTERLLHPARVMSVLLGLLLGILVFRWSKILYGALPALAALFLFCLEPNILTHSSLVTTDISVTCFIFGTVYCLWRLSRLATWGNLAGFTACFALAQLSKFTALLLGPIVLLLLIARALQKTPWPVALGSSRDLLTLRSKLILSAALVVLLTVATFGTIWASYGFHYDATPAGSVRLEAPPAAETPSLVTAAALWAQERHLLPYAYTAGFLGTQEPEGLFRSFLAGEISITGWWFYFPIAFLVKTPLSVLILAGAGLVILLRRRDTFLQDGLFVLLPIVIIMAFAMTSRFNIGVRHVLPVTPFVILLAAAPFAVPLPRLCRSAALALLFLAAAETAAAQPHPQGFFNLLAGGPRNGYKILVDSNVDWGQDLKEMRDWQAGAATRHPGLPTYLSYFGSAAPDYYGIRATLLPGYGHYQLTSQNAHVPLQGGIYCISATMLYGVFSPFPGRWCEPYESRYQDTLARVRMLEAAGNDAAAREDVIRRYGREFWDAELERFEDLRFARLCAALRRRKPDERIGSSILVYILTDPDVRNALFGPPAELAATVRIKGATASSQP